MGVDLEGWVEVQPYASNIHKIPREIRHGVLKAHHIVGRNLDMFGCLFGIENFARFSPIVGIRGLPENLSREAQADFSKIGTFAETWITWAEIAAINWEEQAEGVDQRPHHYLKGEDGTLAYRGKSSPSPADQDAGYPLNQEGTTWERDGVVYCIERLSRGDALSGDWQLLFDLMERLAERYGGEHVRLVAWFDR